MKSHKDEIQAKKAKLAEMKRQREQRHKDFSVGRQSTGSPAGVSPSQHRPETRQELDSLISNLIGDERGSPKPPTTPPSTRRSRASYAVPRQDAESALPLDASIKSAGGALQPLSFAPLTTLYEIKCDPPKKELVTYSKGVQTSGAWSQQQSPSSSDSESDEAPSSLERPRTRRLSRRQKEKDEELRQNIRKEIEEELKALQGTQGDGAGTDGKITIGHEKQNFPGRSLSNEEVEAVTSSADFLDFVEHSSKVIERALDEEYDVLADYRQDNLSAVDDEDNGLGSKGRKGRRIKEVMNFHDDRWSKKRMISDIGFSTKFPELILTSHTKNPSAPYDPAGLLLVWNMHMHSRPEYILHAASDILTAKFSPFHPNLILAGSYSGQVLLFDTRSRSPHPVQRTPLTGSGHTHPVYSLSVVGTQNAHNIVSTSTDGVMCSWSIDMLAHPQEYLELLAPSTLFPSSNATSTATPALPTRVADDLAPTCTAFPPSDPTYALVSTESGNLHIAHRYSRAGARAGIDARALYSGHAAPVMSLDFHQPAGPVDLGDLVLSSSLDWSVKLWRIRTPASSIAANASSSTVSDVSSMTGVISGPSGMVGLSGNSSSTPGTGKVDIYGPVLDIPRDDAVYDAKWSPAKPGVFACVDGAGALEVWDLTVDTEVPLARAFSQRYSQPSGVADINSTVAGSAAVGGLGVGGAGVQMGSVGNGMGRGLSNAKSLNKCAWEPHEGRRIATGGLDGVLGIWEVGGELGGLESAMPEEWGRVKRLVGRHEGAGG